MKHIKLLGAEFTNEALLHILPFGMGYLLKEDTEEAKDIPCEHSITMAMMLQSVEYAINPHKAIVIDQLPQ